ncbi:MAG: hypothetical protein RR517_05215, partial [Pseudomonas sp.]
RTRLRKQLQHSAGRVLALLEPRPSNGVYLAPKLGQVSRLGFSGKLYRIAWARCVRRVALIKLNGAFLF